MSIRAVYINRLRSIESATMAPCGRLNLLIGKNNAGKSNILNGIELLLQHLRRGLTAAAWPTPRPEGQFNNRDQSRPIRISVEFDLPPSLNKELREKLTTDAPHIERSIEQIKSFTSVVFSLAAALVEGQSFSYMEQITIGTLNTGDTEVVSSGIKLLTLTKSVAFEIFNNVKAANNLRDDAKAIDELSNTRRPSIDYVMREPKEGRLRAALAYGSISLSSPGSQSRLEKALSSATSVEEMKSNLEKLSAESRNQAESFEKAETEGQISAFAGETRTPPAYASWLMQQFGEIPVLYIRERKRPIGREEAETLLRLKVRRGGTERLLAVQQTIKALLAVSVDAFEADPKGERGAEMDVDDFLVEANGAGIREALRLILDLELKDPKLVFIEEPEVHLHPGLARVVAAYLREKSREIQMFITTHSTDFVDLSSLQNVFLISRDANNNTICEKVEAEEVPAKIPAELGIRLSTLFMFDRLAFVEGPSDEAILREFAGKLKIDLAQNNVGFVRMGGVRNFAHYAADHTLDLLSRGRVVMTFVTDRDERDDAEVAHMVARLGGRAQMCVLDRREMENYLLIPSAIRQFIAEKQKLAGHEAPIPSDVELRAAIQVEAESLRDEVIRLHIQRQLLKPVFLHTREALGTPEDRIRAATAELETRLKSSDAIRQDVEADVGREWPGNALAVAPGSCILEKVAARFGVTFSKDIGDGERLARYVSANEIPTEIRELLRIVIRN